VISIKERSSGGAWTEQKKSIFYFVMKGVLALHSLDINNTTELLEFYYDDLDFERALHHIII
jgi:hypothetical protein